MTMTTTVRLPGAGVPAPAPARALLLASSLLLVASAAVALLLAPSTIFPTSSSSSSSSSSRPARPSRLEPPPPLLGLGHEPPPPLLLGGPPGRRRLLKWFEDWKRSGPLNPALEDRIKPIDAPPDPSSETALFWHIPKSGGTTLKSLYKCMNRTLAVRVGADPRWGHDRDPELVVLSPGLTGANFVNVDTLSRKGILRAARLGLVPSGVADLVVTSNLNFAVEHLYDSDHPGRVFSLFRHPVDRLVSKFFYSQVATWERSYHPQWQDMNLLEWAENVNQEKDIAVRTLANLKEGAEVTEADLRMAVWTARQLLVIGLMDRMEESIRRFNVFMGIDGSDEIDRRCTDEYFGHGQRKDNSNAHPAVGPDDPAYQILARDNAYDIQLHEILVDLFDRQGEVVEAHARSIGAKRFRMKQRVGGD